MRVQIHIRESIYTWRFQRDEIPCCTISRYVCAVLAWNFLLPTISSISQCFGINPGCMVKATINLPKAIGSIQ